MEDPPTKDGHETNLEAENRWKNHAFKRISLSKPAVSSLLVARKSILELQKGVGGPPHDHRAPRVEDEALHGHRSSPVES